MTTKEKSFKPGSILVVEDRPQNIELLTVILNLQGYKVEQANQGSLAIRSAMARPPDIILLDISQPEMDSFAVCRHLKADPHTQDIPIIFISAANEAEPKIKAFESGASDYITKPFQIEEVIARINNQLQISRLKIELKAKNAHLERELLKRQLAAKKLLSLNQQLGKLAAIDSLTQIANRRIFDEFLTREWQRGQREQRYLSLILCDIDYFKLYNDNLGHHSGDLCLRRVAQAITKAVKRPADLVARYGGEEFAIILPQTSAQNALRVAETIRLKVKQLYLPHPESTVSNYVSISLGVTCLIPQPRYTKKQLLVTADKALYQAKKQGRDRSILITDY
ncbi:MAG: diguanylate cyclase [Pleurocapsa minor HA4230-MV1]|jgi:diguanylate cyclase (GGDEF)-like protein|nr:diguanylate cyclase [Pleurocapsa minor HA4230-MV1]